MDKRQKDFAIPFPNTFQKYLCDPDFESDVIKLCVAMSQALGKNKLKVFNNEDIFNFILLTIQLLQTRDESTKAKLNIPVLNIKYKPYELN